MHSSATTEVNGFVGQDPQRPARDKFPNLVVFPIAVSRKWKDKNNVEHSQTTWYRCSTFDEKLGIEIEEKVRKGYGVSVFGTYDVSGFMGKDGEIKTSIKVNIKSFKVLEEGKSKYGEHNTTSEQPNAGGYLDDDIPF